MRAARRVQAAAVRKARAIDDSQTRASYRLAMRGCGYARMVAGPIGLLIALVVQDGEVGADKVTWKLESVHHPFPNQRWILPEVDFWKRQSDGTQLRVLCSFAYTSDAQTYSSVNGKTLSVVRPESNRFWIR